MVSEWALDPDAALMVKVCGGHEPSFETLLARHRSQVVNHLYRLVRNRAIAEELAQDVFLRVYRFRNRYQPEAKFSTWLFRITTNVALNWRRDTRRETAHLRLDAALHDTRRIQVPDQTLRADQQLLAEYHAKEIRDAIDSLPAKQLAAVLMHKYEGMDYARCSPKCWTAPFPALKSLLFRAYETLRRRAGALFSGEWAQTLPEWQCRPHGAMYISRGPSQVRIWKEVDPVTRQITAWHAEWLRSIDNPYFMDGRPRPSEFAAHTWGGFSTAEFVGDMLKITTTHLKEDYYRRNGVPSSDLATLTQYWIRRGDYLTWILIAYDPVYLTEPMIRSSEYRLALNQQIPPYPCDVVEEVVRPKGDVPHYMPGSQSVPGRVCEEIQLAGRSDHGRRGQPCIRKQPEN
jgi:RNA polymerase sigma-70 factor (ECF subfamily)